jgi:hypothetical protein
MGLRDVLAADAAAFTALADFGEEARYFDQGVGEGRVVHVHVFREEPETNSDLTVGARFHGASLFIARNATTGVTNPTRADEIELSLRPGEAVQRCRVVEVMQADAGGYMLGVSR